MRVIAVTGTKLKVATSKKAAVISDLGMDNGERGLRIPESEMDKGPVGASVCGGKTRRITEEDAEALGTGGIGEEG